MIIRQPNGHREIQHNLMVTENLNFGRNISHEYNLKGPLLTRFTTTTGDGAEEVMLGPKFFKDMNNSPVYVSKDSKHNLQSAVTNDINFLHVSFPLLTIPHYFNHLDFTLHYSIRTWSNPQNNYGRV